MIIKRTCRIVDFVVPADHRVKLKERESTSTLPGNWKNKQTDEHESEAYTNCNWYNHQRIGQRARRLVNKKTSGDNPN